MNFRDRRPLIIAIILRQSSGHAHGSVPIQVISHARGIMNLRVPVFTRVFCFRNDHSSTFKMREYSGTSPLIVT